MRRPTALLVSLLTIQRAQFGVCHNLGSQVVAPDICSCGICYLFCTVILLNVLVRTVKSWSYMVKEIDFTTESRI